MGSASWVEPPGSDYATVNTEKLICRSQLGSPWCIMARDIPPCLWGAFIHVLVSRRITAIQHLRRLFPDLPGLCLHKAGGNSYRLQSVAHYLLIVKE